MKQRKIISKSEKFAKYKNYFINFFRRKAHKLRVSVGDHYRNQTDPYEEFLEVESFITHPKYIAEGHKRDVGILTLKERLHFSNYVRPACLPKRVDENLAGQRGVAIGWGKTQRKSRNTPQRLQEVLLPIWSHEACDTKSNWADTIQRYYLCAGPKNGDRDTCSGDSGRPLMVRDFKTRRYILVGATSFGSECASENNPGIYARVSFFLDWIYYHTNDGCFCENPTP